MCDLGVACGTGLRRLVDRADDVAAASSEGVDDETAGPEHVGQCPVHYGVHHVVRGRAVDVIDAHPVVLAPADDNPAEPRLGDQADSADGATGCGGVVQGQADLAERRCDPDDQSRQRVVVGEFRVPVLGEPGELKAKRVEPRRFGEGLGRRRASRSAAGRRARAG